MKNANLILTIAAPLLAVCFAISAYNGLNTQKKYYKLLKTHIELQDKHIALQINALRHMDREANAIRLVLESRKAIELLSDMLRNGKTTDKVNSFYACQGEINKLTALVKSK